jgi:hypothetical protein
MASQPPRSYKNAAMLPPETKVSIYVDVPPSSRDENFLQNDKTRTLSEDYILRCFSQAMYLSGTQVSPYAWDKYFMVSQYEEALGTFVYEDMTLREMASPDNPSYKKFETNLKWIADTLQCHVSVFVGHIETCGYYIDTIYKQAIEGIKFYTSRPTIFLIVACRGDELAYQLNTESQYDIFRKHKIAFFGFEDLLHIHEGELYSTKLFDRTKSKAICDSEEMVRLLNSLDDDMDKAGIDAKMPLNPEQVLAIFRHNPDLEVFKCCRAKLGRLYSDFVKGLDKRQTTKYTKEQLAHKFKPYTENPKLTLLPKKFTTFVDADGINCDKNPCDIPNLYEADELIAQEYNKKGAYHTLFRELKSYIKPSYIYFDLSFQSEKEFKDSIEQFFRRIQGLKGNEMSIFTYTPNRNIITPILWDLLYDQGFGSVDYPLFKTMRFIFQKYSQALDFTIQDPNDKYSILHTMLSSQLFTEKEEYILFKTIYDSLPNEKEREAIFFLQDKNRNIPILSKNTFRPLVCMFYIEKFGSKLKEVKYRTEKTTGNLLHAVLENYIPETPNEKQSLFLDCVKGLLNVGVDPNEKLREDYTYNNMYTSSLVVKPTVKPLERYAELYLPPYNTTLFTTFVQYGMTNETQFFTKEKEFYEGVKASQAKLSSFVKIVEALKRYLVEFEDEYRNLIQAGGMPRYRYYSNNYGYNSPPNSPYNSNNRYDIYETIIFGLSKEELAAFTLANKLHLEYPTQWNSFKLNIDTFLRSIPESITKTVQLFQILVQSRKGVKKHGSKVRRTYKVNKRNLNKTIKNKLNSIQWNVNGEKMIGDYVGKILELAKRKEFTKEEKANYKQRPLKIQKSALQPLEKYTTLKELYEQMVSVLKTR